MLKLKLQYFGHLVRMSWLNGKDSDARKDWRQEEKGMTEYEMAGWHHRLDGHEYEWTLGVGDGHGGLACCDSWGRKQSDMTERLNWTELSSRNTGNLLLYSFIPSPPFYIINDVEAETPILWPSDVKRWLIWKDPDAGKDWRGVKKGTTKDEIVGWHHWLNGNEFE